MVVVVVVDLDRGDRQMGRRTKVAGIQGPQPPVVGRVGGGQGRQPRLVHRVVRRVHLLAVLVRAVHQVGVGGAGGPRGEGGGVPRAAEHGAVFCRVKRGAVFCRVKRGAMGVGRGAGGVRPPEHLHGAGVELVVVVGLRRRRHEELLFQRILGAQAGRAEHVEKQVVVGDRVRPLGLGRAGHAVDVHGVVQGVGLFGSGDPVPGAVARCWVGGVVERE